MHEASSSSSYFFRTWSFYLVSLPFAIILITMILFFEEVSLRMILTSVLLFCILPLPIYFWSKKLKKVEINLSSFNFSDSKRQVEIPFHEISEIRQGILGWINPETVTIILKNKSIFGTKICFVPKHRSFAFGDHPIVDELKNVIKKEKMY